MFGGIWLGDREVLEASGLENPVLCMRVCSLLMYVALFIVACRIARCRRIDVRLFLGACSVLGLAMFAAGALVVLAVLPQLPADCADRRLIGLAGLSLTKFVGAPVSVWLACAFALLDRTAVMRACALGMLGAFALYSTLSQAGVACLLGTIGAVGAAGLLLVCSIALCMAGTELSLRAVFRRASPRAHGTAFAAPGVVKRPLSKVLTPGYAVAIVLSAVMLGFLRNGLATGSAAGVDPHADPASLVALVALLAAALLWKDLRTEHVFYGALLFATAGILLQPVLSVAAPGASEVLCGLGTALFEVVMWSLVVWVARNSTDAFVAASAARLVAVVGHLAGTAVVVGVGMILGPSLQDTLHASGLVVVLAYVLLLVAQLGSSPQLQVPFLSPSVVVSDARGASCPAPKDADCGEGRPADVSRSENEADIDRRYWVEPCDAVADMYRLTAREREVLELMARGRDMPYMGETLCISRNTLKMHIRHMYTKLDAHSRQDVISIVEEARQLS
ncbi:helix-turn-helix transcriptional regulator [Gordonibacter sp. An230]|uniref:helix-turn-helix transcriptional regulator n=1 Tax=Gordonibacter sp. An230 TaxID=1965592 RepID=UPI0013A65D8D|nr:helix-turn-helix transcriptional regulator [Gordonibacter sp. An230]